MKSLICVIKRLESRPLNHDLTVEMHPPPPPAFHQSRYNSFKYATCADVIWWTLSPRDSRAVFQRAIDPTPHVNPRHQHLKYCVELSPTRRKLKKTIQFIRCNEYEGLASSEYGMHICSITLSNKIYIMYTSHRAA